MFLFSNSEHKVNSFSLIQHVFLKKCLEIESFFLTFFDFHIFFEKSKYSLCPELSVFWE